MKKEYEQQARLLLEILPFVAQEEHLALHGGTAINLFVRDMPRLSVDIDLTYLPLQDRATSLQGIKSILLRLKKAVESTTHGIKVDPKPEIGKLLISNGTASIKLEINLVGRGSYQAPTPVLLCNKAQEEFNSFVEINMIAPGQLFGGKVCAALDRQHPRDLFDIKYMLETDGFSEEIKQGFIYCLLGSERPIFELLNPHRNDQQEALKKQFEGMSDEPFTYADYEETREKLIANVQASLTSEDKAFLIAFKKLEPDWSLYDYQEYPAIKWKTLNLQKLRETNPKKYMQQFNRLNDFLGNDA